MVHKLTIECNTTEELANAMVVLVQAGITFIPEGFEKKKKPHPKQVSGVVESWKEATALAEKHGISRNAARSILSEARRKGEDPEVVLKRQMRPKKA